MEKAALKGLMALAAVFVTPLLCAGLSADYGPKTAPALFTAEMRRKAAANAAQHPWAKEFQKQICGEAEPWMRMSDDELWRLMFGPAIKRSWMVWSNGYCPACKKDVPMYQWEMDALNTPWKTRCPHCKELFPKNDFYKFYLSGMDEHYVFDPARADRSLLFNEEHPDPADPLHGFGVDDGEGYVEDGKRWRFIGAYLIYGQWKQAVVRGIKSLAAAYVVTGDTRYAHKAAVMLDRVADLYPSFDFGREGVMYEGPPARGYVSTWHDACWETLDLALAYDQIFDAIENDAELQKFLAVKARRYRLENKKASAADIRRNIEDRILRDALANRPKIESNYPQTDITLAFIRTVLGWPGNRAEVMGLLGEIIAKTTAVDGVTGEKGLSGYACLGPRSLGLLLGRYAAADPGFLRDMLKQQPRIKDCYRFHIDTWCLNGSYYPAIGDCSSYARKCDYYCGLALMKNYTSAVGNIPSIAPSMFAFLWDLYAATKDPAFVQVLYRGIGYSLEGLPYDLFAEDPAAFQKSVKEVIGRHGDRITLGSVNKQEWRVGIMRSGSGEHERAMWLDYDSTGGHSHFDGMNLGLFGMGLDLLPDFGYPPVQYGGWGAPRARWYTMTAAHNTVVVDGKNQPRADGKTTLWAAGTDIHAIRASCPEMAGGRQYERTAVMVDVSDRSFYIVDVFRVIGGTDHTKFLHSYFGSIAADGLSLIPTADFTQGTQMRNFRFDPAPRQGWSADWKIEDQFGYLNPDARPHIRYFDFTSGAQAYTAEQWVSTNLFSGSTEAWIPAIVVRRQAKEGELASTFAGLIEPYDGEPSVKSVRRLALNSPDGAEYPDSCVALEVTLADGRRDVLILADAENPMGLQPNPAKTPLVQRDTGVTLDGELCLVRFGADDKVRKIAVCRGRWVKAGGQSVEPRPGDELTEVNFGSVLESHGP